MMLACPVSSPGNAAPVDARTNNAAIFFREIIE
jgi:hypothetical protein